MPQNGWNRQKLDQLRHELNGWQRKVDFTMLLARTLRRPPSLDELITEYTRNGMVGNPAKDGLVRERELAKVLDLVADTFDPSLLGSGGFQLDHYAFIDEIPISDDSIPENRSRQAVLEALKVFVHLVEVAPNNPHGKPFTVGLKQLGGYIIRLRNEHILQRASSNRTLLSAARDLSGRLRLTDVLKSHCPGHSRRYILGLGHPRYEEYMYAHGALIERSGGQIPYRFVAPRPGPSPLQPGYGP